MHVIKKERKKEMVKLLYTSESEPQAKGYSLICTSFSVLLVLQSSDKCNQVSQIY